MAFIAQSLPPTHQNGADGIDYASVIDGKTSGYISSLSRSRILRNSTCTIVVILTRVPLPIHGSLLIEVIMSVVFGRRTMADDEDVEALFRTIDMFIGNQVPGKWIVDGYPQLAKLPKWLQWWRPYGEQCFNETVG